MIWYSCGRGKKADFFSAMTRPMIDTGQHNGHSGWPVKHLLRKGEKHSPGKTKKPGNSGLLYS
jgi:hypothetical protein